MGLDIALGIMVLLGAVRGWFRGFVLQAIRLGGLVGSVYAADPIRDYARPHVMPYLTNIPAYLLDRMLWWASAVVAYVALVGLSTLAVKLYRKRPYGEPEPNRADQFAGLLLAGAKSAVIASFLVAAMDKYALTWVKKTNWASDMTRESVTLSWHEQYRPSERIWSAAPVQHFVAHVQQMGISSPMSGEANPSLNLESPPVQASESRPPRLDLPTLEPRLDEITRKLDEELQRINRP